jgi:hypothetical protein
MVRREARGAAVHTCPAERKLYRPADARATQLISLFEHLQLALDRPLTKLHAYRSFEVPGMDVEVQQAEKRATRRFALRLPVSVNSVGEGGASLTAQTRDVSARGICFYLDAPMSTGSAIEFTLTLPPEITLTENIRVRCKGKVVRVDDGLVDAKTPVAAVIDEYEFLSES